MSTKQNELANDRFAPLDDEPTFTLLARDPSAPWLVEQWATRRMREIENSLRPDTDRQQVEEAFSTAYAMRCWRIDNDGKWRKGTTLFPNLEDAD